MLRLKAAMRKGVIFRRCKFVRPFSDTPRGRLFKLNLHPAEAVRTLMLILNPILTLQAERAAGSAAGIKNKNKIRNKNSGSASQSGSQSQRPSRAARR